MAAAAIVPTVVQKTYMHATGSLGAPLRMVKYLIKITKVTQADWVVVATYITSGTFLYATGWTIDGSGDGAIETMTYVSSGTKLTFGSADVGTAYAEAMYQE